MRCLLFGVVLGLLAAVHSSPAHTATQIAEDEVIREAATDGFLVDNLFLPSGAPESPGTNVTASQRPTPDAAEGSGGESGDATSATLRFDTTVGSASPQPAAPSSRPGSTSVPSRAAGRAVSAFDLLSNEVSASGSGDGEMFGQDATAPAGTGVASGSATEAPSRARFLGEKVPGGRGSGDRSEQESGSEPNVGTPNSPPATSKPGGTPGWMIIAGFIVGLAALVVIFVAIATRDSWNGPNQAAQLVGKANPSTQQVELETFLHKEVPKENGHASEYTVIPLEDLLPEQCPSH
ncbi:collagen alpha-2(I) chain-like [Pungitius pungitius]|uniref:collagen alpha-2(I) chain-like n=1 Tax=Pungitius pungitius TaxID=134920 RepID=UPI002E153789